MSSYDWLWESESAQSFGAVPLDGHAWGTLRVESPGNAEQSEWGAMLPLGTPSTSQSADFSLPVSILATLYPDLTILPWALFLIKPGLF